MKIPKLLLTSIFLLFFGVSTAQNQEETAEESLSLDEGTIANQFLFVEKKSGNYRANGIGYEVVKMTYLNQLKQHVLDSLQNADKTIKSLQNTINKQANTIASLNNTVADTANKLETVNKEKDSVSFLGMQLSKGSYSALVWGIIFILTLLFLLFVYKFRNSNILTQEAKSALVDVEAEFEEHRRRALEREQKISRQLQDELNKQKKSK